MIYLILLILLLPFALVLLVGAPYLPTRKAKANEALDLMNLNPGDIFVDFGSGDGAVLVEAAKRGLRCYGYELNPLIWAVSMLRCIKYNKNITIYCKSFWGIKIPEGTRGVFVFLLDKYMEQLEVKLQNELKNCTVISYTFQLPNKKYSKKEKALFLYRY